MGYFELFYIKQDIQNVLKNTVKRVSKTRFTAYLYHFETVIKLNMPDLSLLISILNLSLKIAMNEFLQVFTLDK